MANKTAGTIYEYKFFAKILELGYDLFIPAGDNLPLDCIVQNGAGKLYKVQIKGTASENREEGRAGKKRYKVLAATGQNSKMSIDCTKVDILAAYVQPVDTWYIIPCLELSGTKSVWFYPHNLESKSKTSRYAEFWDLFKRL